MATMPILYDYWRSSASYRVRIAFNLLGRRYQAKQVDLLSGAHSGAEYLAQNPQGLLPTLEIDGHRLTQSLAIIEYLHATTPGSHLLPDDVLGQVRVRQLSYAVAMEIHPVCNLSVVAHVAEVTQDGDAAKRAWMQHFIAKGLAGLEGLLAQGQAGQFCYGDTPGMADCCLIPQLYNATRWGVEYQAHKNIARIAASAANLAAFKDAHPDIIKAPKT